MVGAIPAERITIELRGAAQAASRAKHELERLVMNHRWLVDRSEHGNEVNFVWGYFNISRQRPMKFGFTAFRHDCLPIRWLGLGPICIRWGSDHEWLQYDREDDS